MTSRNGGRGGIANPSPADNAVSPCGDGTRQTAPGDLVTEVDRRDQARRVRTAGPGDAERRAVVRRGAHEGQADRDVHRAVEVQRLDRDQDRKSTRLNSS